MDYEDGPNELVDAFLLALDAFLLALDEAVGGEPQFVLRSGEPAVVMVSYEDWKALQAALTKVGL